MEGQPQNIIFSSNEWEKCKFLFTKYNIINKPKNKKNLSKCLHLNSANDIQNSTKTQNNSKEVKKFF